MNRKAAIVGAGLLGLVGCNKTAGSYRGAAGTLASSQDGALVYAVDTDNQQMIVANASDGSKVTAVSVGANPARILVGPDDTIYVSNRGERTVSVIAKNGFKEVTRIPVGVEPVGLSISDDGSELYVVSSTDLNDPTHGTLTAVDTTSYKPTWSVAVGEEPRGVAFANGKAYVTNFKAGSLTVVDVSKHAVATTVDLNNADDPDPSTNPGSASAGLVADVTASPDGTRVYAPHVWQRNGAIGLPVGTPGGYYQTGGPCGVGAIVSPGVGTVQTSDDSNLVDSFSTCAASGGYQSTTQNYPPSVIFPDRTSGTPANVFQSPSVAVVDPTNSWLFMANRDSNNIVVLSTNTRIQNTDPSQTNVATDIELADTTISSGGIPDNTSGVAPDGLLISKDGKTLYAYSQLGHELELIRQTDPSNPLSLGVVSRSQLATDTLVPDQVTGRQMFFSAVDQRISGINTGISCASCHTAEGSEDGHTWRFPDGPRRTPVLAGRDVAATAPYHWTGVFDTLPDFMNETLIKRMGGTGLTEANPNPPASDPSSQVATADGQLLINYMEGLKALDNPLQNRPDLANTMAVGQAAFHQASCDTCHVGAALTNNQVANVGTITGSDLLENTEDTSQFNPLTSGFNVPSLLGVGRSAPYLHDGSVLTLAQRVADAANPNQTGTLLPTDGSPPVAGVNYRHGDATSLTSAQQSALVTYLSSL